MDEEGTAPHTSAEGPPFVRGSLLKANVEFLQYFPAIRKFIFYMYFPHI